MAGICRLSKTLSYVFIVLSLLIFAFLVVSVIVIYFNIGVKSSGVLRLNALKIAFGYILTFSGEILHIFRTNIPIPFNYLDFLIVNAIGLILLRLGYLNIIEVNS